MRVPGIALARRMLAAFVMIAAALAFCGARFAAAASITVDPVRIELSGEQQSATVTVRNAGSEPVVVQAEVLVWSQVDGQDVYTRTRDALVTPTVITVPARADQIVRIALRSPPHATQERAFRLYVQEVPAPPKPGKIGLNVSLRIGIPVFVAPTEGRPTPRLIWRAKREAGGELRLAAENNGTGNARLNTLTLVDPSGRTVAQLPDLAYVLPGHVRAWKLSQQQHSVTSRAGGPLRLRGESYAGAIDDPVTLE
ncbi:MAG: molecular chaperone [Burkholderiales bacterium]